MTTPLVYVAGAIDYADHDEHSVTAPAHLADFWPVGAEVFCPKCENEGETSAESVMVRNWDAVHSADLVVAFLSTAVFTVGTPIEIWEKAKVDPRRVVLVHDSVDGSVGLFVRWWEKRGVTVVATTGCIFCGDVSAVAELRNLIAERLVALL